MKLSEVHNELTLLGVNSPEVHALVDDLHLDFGSVPDWLRDLLRVPSVQKFPAYVYSPHTSYKEKTGRLF